MHWWAFGSWWLWSVLTQWTASVAAVWHRTFNIVSWLCKKKKRNGHYCIYSSNLLNQGTARSSEGFHSWTPALLHGSINSQPNCPLTLFSFSKYSNRAVQVGHVPAMLLNSHLSKPDQGADWFCLWCLISAQCPWLCSQSSLFVKCSLQLDLCLRLVGMLVCPGLWSHNAVLVYWVWIEHSLGKSWGKHRGSHFNTMTGKQVLS